MNNRNLPVHIKSHPYSFIFIAALVAGAIVVGNGYVLERRDAFSYSGLFLTEMLIKNGKLDDSSIKTDIPAFWTDHASIFVDQNRIGISTLLAPLSLITNIGPEILVFIPVISLLYLALGGLIAREFTRNKIVVIAYMAYLVFQLNINFPHDFRYHNVAYVYYLVMIFAVIKLLNVVRSRELQKNTAILSNKPTDSSMKSLQAPVSSYKRSSIFLLLSHTPISQISKLGNLRIIVILCVIASVPMYYAVVGFNMAFLLGVTGAMYILSKVRRNTSTKTKSPILIGTITIFALISVVFLVSDPIVFDQLDSGWLMNADENSGRFFSQIEDLTQLSTSSFSKSTPLSTDITSLYLSVAILSITFSSAIIYVVHAILKNRIDITVVVVSAVIVASVFEPLMYLGVTSLIFRNATFILPLFAMFAIHQFSRSANLRIIGIALIVAMVAMNGVRYYLAMENSVYDSWTAEHYSSTLDPVTDWSISSFSSGGIISSHQISGILFGKLVQFDKENDLYVDQFNKRVLAFEVGEPAILCQDLYYKAVVLSDYFKYQTVYGALYGEDGQIAPMGDKIYVINDTDCFNKQYDDGTASVYVRR